MNDRFGITLEKLQDGLGFSTIALPGNTLVVEKDIAMIREAGISRIELCGLFGPGHFNYRDPKYLAEIKRACERQGVSVVSVHAPCPDYADSDDDKRAAAVEDTVIAGHAAAELGASVFVAHFGICERSEESIHEVLDGLGDTELTVTIENLPHIPDLGDYLQFMDRIDSDRFGLTVDIGHVRDPDGSYPFSKKSHARETLAQCGSRVVHLHLHDVRPHDKNTWMDHFPPFSGVVLWDEVFMALKDIGYSGEYMFEPASSVTLEGNNNGWVSLEETILGTAAFPKEFFSRHEP